MKSHVHCAPARPGLAGSLNLMGPRLGRRLVLLGLACSLGLGWLQAGEAWTTYRTKPGTNNLVKVEGTSTLHDWRCISRNISGTLETGPAFALESGKLKAGDSVPLKATVGIPVRSLRSVNKDYTPYNEGMDKVMYEKLNAETNRFISYQLESLVLKEPPVGAGGPWKFEARGKLGVAGVTNEVSLPVEIVSAGSGLKVSGTLGTKMSAFKVEPPVLAIVKTGDEVQLSFTWLVEPKK